MLSPIDRYGRWANFLSQYVCMPSGSLLHIAVLPEQWQAGGGSGITALYTVRGFVR